MTPESDLIQDWVTCPVCDYEGPHVDKGATSTMRWLVCGRCRHELFIALVPSTEPEEAV